MTKVDDWLEIIPSRHTRKNYVNGIKRFEKWYGKSITTLIKSPAATKTIEKFFVYLKQNHPQNTARNVTNAAIQFLKYFGTDVRPRKALGIYRTEKSTKHHRLTISEVQRMAEVSSLKEQISLAVWLLGFRISDVIKLKKANFDVLEQEAPIPIMIRAAKEGTIYETFISQEFKNLLRLYLPTIEGEWLLPGPTPNTHTKDKTLNRLLQRLAKRASIRLHGTLSWHCARRLVMSTGAQLGLNVWIIKKLLGKSIHHSDDTYLETDLKEGFLKLCGVLKLKPNANANGRINSIQEIAHVAAEALMEFLEPVIEKKLLARQASRGGESLGLMTKPDLSGMSTKEKLELYIKLVREEKEKWR